MLLSGILFAALLNFKHIFLYMAPAYFVYLLKAHCFVSGQAAPPPLYGFSIKNFLLLGGCVAGVFAVSLGPFLHQLPALIGRLFPFTRGLCHAYWAPNFWALYAGADRLLIHGKISSEKRERTRRYKKLRREKMTKQNFFFGIISGQEIRMVHKRSCVGVNDSRLCW